MNRALLVTCYVLLLSSCTDRAAEPKASRPAWPGCKWERHEFKELGVKLLFQNCEDPVAHYELRVKGSWLEMHRPTDGVTDGGPQFLQVFSKPANQSIQDAIRSRFVERITLENKSDELIARQSCQVVPVNAPAFGADKLAFTLSPSGDYKTKIYDELKEGPRDFGCGWYGEDQITTYFEYHPKESSTKFAFVVYGPDEPLFDEESIEFIGN